MITTSTPQPIQTNNLLSGPISNTGASQTDEAAPNQTLYINNLNEKVKLEELKQGLFFLFSPYGDVIDIIAKKNIKMRGQAFVLFRNLQPAINALRDLQGYLLFDKPMRVNYAKSKSDIIAKEEGTYQPREKQKPKVEEKKLIQKKQKPDQVIPNQISKAQNQSKPQTKQAVIVPNNILFVENLPPGINEEMLIALFHQYPGFREVRLIPVKNVAFVEYDDEFQAGIAMSGLNTFKILPDYPLQISYAKK